MNRRLASFVLGCIGAALFLLPGGATAQVTTADDGLALRERAEAKLLVRRIRIEPKKRADAGECGELTHDDLEVRLNGRSIGPEIRVDLERELESTVHAIAIDTSLSIVVDHIDAIRRAAKEYVDGIDADDRGMVLGFDDSVVLWQAVTDDRRRLHWAIDRLQFGHQTALLDGVYRAVRVLEHRTERPVLIVLTDGHDTGSQLRAADVVAALLRRPDLTVFTIGVGLEGGGNAEQLEAIREARHTLSQLAESTGGEFIRMRARDDISSVFRRVHELLDREAVISLSGFAEDPGKASVSVKSRRGRCKVSVVGPAALALEGDASRRDRPVAAAGTEADTTSRRPAPERERARPIDQPLTSDRRTRLNQPRAPGSLGEGTPQSGEVGRPPASWTEASDVTLSGDGSMPIEVAISPTHRYQLERWWSAGGSCGEPMLQPPDDWRLELVGRRARGCLPGMVLEFGNLWSPRQGRVWHNEKPRIETVAVEVSLPPTERLPTRPWALLPELADRLGSTDATGHDWRAVPQFVHGGSLLEMREALAATALALPDYRRLAEAQLQQRAEQRLEELARRLALAVPAATPEQIDLAVRASARGQAVLAATQPTPSASVDDVAAWLGDVPAVELFRGWEMEAMRRALERPEDWVAGVGWEAFIRSWQRIQPYFAAPVSARTLGLLLPARDLGSDRVGYWRVVLPRPAWIHERMVWGAAAILRHSNDLVPPNPYGVWMLGALEARGLSPAALLDGFRLVGMHYRLAGFQRVADPRQAYQRFELVMRFEPMAASGQLQRVGTERARPSGFELSAQIIDNDAPQIQSMRVRGGAPAILHQRLRAMFPPHPTEANAPADRGGAR